MIGRGPRLSGRDHDDAMLQRRLISLANLVGRVPTEINEN
jgi:hypothetical protein